MTTIFDTINFKTVKGLIITSVYILILAIIDIFSEIEVLKALEAEKEDKITIIISHNKSTLSICDKIIKLG